MFTSRNGLVIWVVAWALCAPVAISAQELQCNSVDFEAFADGDPIGQVSGVPLATFDISWLAARDSDAGGSMPIANEPSPETAVQISPNPVIDFDIPARQIDFSYSARAAALPVLVQAWSGSGGTGSVVASVELTTVGFSGDGAACSGDPTGGYCLWDLGQIALSEDVISSVTFTAQPGIFGVFFDDMTFCAGEGGGGAFSFVDVTDEAGLAYVHDYGDFVNPPGTEMPKRISGGVASGDFDADGWVDLYVVQGDQGPTMLFRNQGDGTFVETALDAGVQIASPNGYETGPAFGDVNGDGLLDLFVGNILQWEDGSAPRVFVNQGDGTFLEDQGTGLSPARENTFSAIFGDYDLDGWLDVFMAHWSFADDCPCEGHLWHNNGDGTFTNVDAVAGIAAKLDSLNNDRVFAPNFADINNDGWPDLLLASDFGSSQVYLNDGDGTFTDVTDPLVQTDQNGMGGTVGDYDNDGNLDWFVSSIWNNQDKTGNRLYHGLGDGTFEEVSAAAGVRDGLWGWGACFADFDNDGNGDVLHVNGWQGPAFETDPVRLFLSNGDGTFSETAAQLGLVDVGKGRGLSCFDYDRDGDIDVFISNNNGGSSMWRNDGGNLNPWVNVTLKGLGPNVHGVGGRVYVTTGSGTQMRELRMGGNFSSQDPTEAHFGLGEAVTTIDELEVIWPDGLESRRADVSAERAVEVQALAGLAEDKVITQLEPLFFGGCDVCQVEAELSLADGGGSGPVRAGLVGWLQGGPTNVLAVIDATNDRVTLAQRQNGQFIALDHAFPTIDEGVTYDLRVAFDGSDFRVWLDGALLLQVPSAYAGTPSGDAGVMPRNAAVSLSNLAVTTLTDR